jgi:hypothetical protein
MAWTVAASSPGSAGSTVGRALHLAVPTIERDRRLQRPLDLRAVPDTTSATRNGESRTTVKPCRRSQRRSRS